MGNAFMLVLTTLFGENTPFVVLAMIPFVMAGTFAFHWVINRIEAAVDGYKPANSAPDNNTSAAEDLSLQKVPERCKSIR
jgi:hypothetical protein